MVIIDLILVIQENQMIQMLQDHHLPIVDVILQNLQNAIKTVIVIENVVIVPPLILHVVPVLEVIPNHPFLMIVHIVEKKMVIFINLNLDEKKMKKMIKRNQLENVDFIQSIKLIYLMSLDYMVLMAVQPLFKSPY
jgi:hypothetical protein